MCISVIASECLRVRVRNSMNESVLVCVLVNERLFLWEKFYRSYLFGVTLMSLVPNYSEQFLFSFCNFLSAFISLFFNGPPLIKTHYASETVVRLILYQNLNER